MVTLSLPVRIGIRRKQESGPFEYLSGTCCTRRMKSYFFHG